MTPEIKVLLGDITEVNNVDAIVNAANCSLLGGGGVDGAIHKAAGPRLREECKQLGGCLTGKAKITDAYLLPVKKIIHTVGPIYVDGRCGEAELLSACYWNSLVVAKQNGLRSVAFPSISTGIFHFPLSRAATVAINTTLEFLDFYPGSIDLVEWICFDKQTRDAYKKEVKRVIGA